MMATDDIKEMLVDCGKAVSTSDLKRTSKKRMGAEEVRTFQNTKTGLSWWVFGDADDESYHPAGDHLYCFFTHDGKLMVCFNPVSYWKTDKALWDQHCCHAIKTMFDLPDWINLYEQSENHIAVTFPSDKTQEDVKAALESAGLLFDQAFHDHVARWV